MDKKIDVYRGCTPNKDCIGIEGYEFYGSFANFEAFKYHIESMSENEKPSVLIGFRIGELYYDNQLNCLGTVKKAWGKEK